MVFNFQASLKMFQDLELTKIFQMDHTVLCRWLLTVKKNYRPEVYKPKLQKRFNILNNISFLF